MPPGPPEARRHQVDGVLFGDGPAASGLAPGATVVVMAIAALALALAEAMHLDPVATCEVLGGGAAASFMLEDGGARMVHDTDEVKSALDIFVEDIGVVTDAARARSQRGHGRAWPRPGFRS